MTEHEVEKKKNDILSAEEKTKLALKELGHGSSIEIFNWIQENQMIFDVSKNYIKYLLDKLFDKGEVMMTDNCFFLSKPLSRAVVLGRRSLTSLNIGLLNSWNEKMSIRNYYAKPE